MSKGSLWGLNFVLKKFFFVFFLVFAKMSREITVFSVRNNQHVCHNCLTRVQEYFLKNFFWRSSFFLHWALRDFLCHFGNNLSVPLSVLLSVCHLDQFVVKDFLSKTFFSYQFRILIEVDQSVFVIFSAKLTTLHSKSPMDQFEDIKPFRKSFVHLSVADLVRKSKSYFSENNRQVRQNCLPRVQGDLLKKFFWKKIVFYFIIGHWAIFFCHFDKILLLPFSVLLSVCQKDQFVVKSFCPSFFSPIIFGYWSQIYRSLFIFFPTKSTTLHSTSPGVNLRTYNRFVKTLFVSFIFCVPWANKSRLFSRKQSAGLSKLLTTCPRWFLKKFFWKSSLFIIGLWASCFCHFY